ncbi:amino acid ABC transporter substrate-binding protein [Pseudoneobacillus rhizosphaerae]|uniref:L-cystine-binding protein TcyA n=1 Tax=Pseudoneobacillus rhizosphaerae TaxID=2880968 RepID=A0A9C7GC04_9BACI|nr:amino acid ABC transporter substrate-binding protein [Pseudoneobacillus rhizosphaerae]CAG9609719.1 L-cystine-binding protein TcyA [Pseudoneobacillus rhizosphaerae]
MKKFPIMFALLVSFMIILAGCGTSENKANNQDNQTEENATGGKGNASENQDLLAEIKDEGVLTVGTEGTYPPFTFHNEKGELTGFDVEIAREVAERLGVEAKFMETQWDAIFAGLDSERFDMIANQVGIRPDRQEKYDFSEGYITSAAVLIVNDSNNDIKAFEDINGKKSAQSLTSNYGDIAKSYGAELIGVEGFNQAIELLAQNRADATINDKLSFLDFKKQKPDAPVKIVATSEDASHSGLMFRKGNETLVEEVNKALQGMIDDGTYLEISKKWFGEDVLK